MRLRAFRTRHIAILVVGTMCLSVLAGGAVVVAADATSAATTFQARAMALRKAGIERTGTALHVFGLIPGIGRLLPPDAPDDDRDTILGAIWGPFFENTIVEVGSIQSPAPIALYYNPLLDVALATEWERVDQGTYRITKLHVVPGERLTAPETAVPVTPRWMTEEEPVAAIGSITVERLAALGAGGQAESGSPGDFDYDRAERDLRAAQPRLLWNVLQRSQWSEAAGGWLSGTIAVIDEAMALNDAAALMAAAPDTDTETATVLASLPDDFVSDLVLDMVLEPDEVQRLLIVSTRHDGEVYVLIRCRLDSDAGVCGPRQLALAKVR